MRLNNIKFKGSWYNVYLLKFYYYDAIYIKNIDSDIMHLVSELDDKLERGIIKLKNTGKYKNLYKSMLMFDNFIAIDDKNLSSIRGYIPSYIS